ncbi:MAG: hypothetical protein ACLGGX_01185 [Bdellovibrionia bacterium]
MVLLTSWLMLACEQHHVHNVESVTDDFVQKYTYNNKVDIVWVIDTSMTMAQHQTILAAQIPELVLQLNKLKMDYRMVAVSTDISPSGPGGKFLGEPKVINAKTKNFEALLRQRIIFGETQSPMERGLESLRMTFDPYYLQTEGKGFLRPDAMLVVNVLSNEDDDSGQTAQYWADYFDSVKPRWVDGSRSWILNFIGVLAVNSGCSTFGNYAEPGALFMALADMSNGVKESICTTNLGKAVSNIRARLMEVITEYKLSRFPEVSSIVVRIDNILVPQDIINGWSYNERRNSIYFHGAWVPKADSKIVVDFVPDLARSE